MGQVGKHHRVRLDEALVARGLAATRAQARALILAGDVRVGGQVAGKAGLPVSETDDVQVAQPPRFVSRGGDKLAHALETFAIDVAGKTCADLGASTGGFTDCLLAHGAARVFALDVGYGQLHWRLRQDPRVVVMERVNVRYLEALPTSIDLITIDVSFIGLALILPVARRLLTAAGQVVALVKPQFEAGPARVGKGGVVREAATHRDVLVHVLHAAHAAGFAARGLTRSPLLGPAGNVEFLLWLGPPAVVEPAEQSLLASVGLAPE